MTLPANLLALRLRALLHIRSLLLVAAFLLPSVALAGLKVSNSDIQALIDKGHFMTAYQQCVNKGYTDDKEKILDFFHEKVGVLENAIPEGANVTAIETGRYPTVKIEIDGITIFRKDLAYLEEDAERFKDPEFAKIAEEGARTPAFIDELNFKISDHLKLNLIPPTEARSSRIYQVFVTEGRSGRELGYSRMAQISDDNPELGKLAVWDALTGQQDRSSPDNWLVTDSGELVAIDNSESLQEDHANYSKTRGGKKIESKVENLTKEQLERFFDKPETFKAIEDSGSLSNQFETWTKEIDLNKSTFETLHDNLVGNVENLQELAEDENITAESIQKSAPLLKSTDKNKLTSRYKLANGNSTTEKISCD
ncbi:MAG: hypothetical protein ACR2PT_12475 [Endozoicomonas sp.]